MRSQDKVTAAEARLIIRDGGLRSVIDATKDFINDHQDVLFMLKVQAALIKLERELRARARRKNV